MRCTQCEISSDSVFAVHPDGRIICASCRLPVLVDRITLLESAMMEFCSRVERGEIRSVNTYKKFKQLLEDKG